MLMVVSLTTRHDDRTRLAHHEGSHGSSDALAAGQGVRHRLAARLQREAADPGLGARLNRPRAGIVAPQNAAAQVQPFVHRDVMYQYAGSTRHHVEPRPDHPRISRSRRLAWPPRRRAGVRDVAPPWLDCRRSSCRTICGGRSAKCHGRPSDTRRWRRCAAVRDDPG